MSQASNQMDKMTTCDTLGQSTVVLKALHQKNDFYSFVRNKLDYVDLW